MRTYTLHLADPDSKRHYNKELFTIVAPRYGIATRVLSFGRDGMWKEKLIADIPAVKQPVVVDVATGTGDIVHLVKTRFPAVYVLGVDQSLSMLSGARKRMRRTGIDFCAQDMDCLGLKSSCADIVTAGYALRNAPDFHKTLAEMHRIVKPGGYLALLDFAHAAHPLLWRIEYSLLKLWGNVWGLLLHGNPAVYGYIARSLDRFPDRKQLRFQLENTGFSVKKTRMFFFGFVDGIVAQKQ